MHEPNSILSEPEGPEEASIFGDFSFLGQSPLVRLIFHDIRDIFENSFNSWRGILRDTLEDRLGLHAPIVGGPLPGTGNLVNLKVTLHDIQVIQALDGNGDHAEINFKFDVGGQTWSYYKEGIDERGDVVQVNHDFILNNWNSNNNLVIRTYGAEVDPNVQKDDPLPTGYTILTPQDFYDHNFQTTARNSDGSFDFIYDWSIAVTPVSSTSASDLVLA